MNKTMPILIGIIISLNLSLSIMAHNWSAFMANLLAYFWFIGFVITSKVAEEALAGWKNSNEKHLKFLKELIEIKDKKQNDQSKEKLSA